MVNEIQEDFNYTLTINIRGNKDRFYGEVIEDNFDPKTEATPENLQHRAYVVYTLLHLTTAISGGVLPMLEHERTADNFDSTLFWLMLMSMADRLHVHLSNQGDGVMVCSCQYGQEQSEECYIGIIDTSENDDGE